MNWQKRGGRIVNGVRHMPSCACAVCDPADTKCKAARERWKADEAARRALAAAAPAAPVVRAHLRSVPLAPCDDTRRFAELLRAGKARVQAFEIIESEKTQQKGTS